MPERPDLEYVVPVLAKELAGRRIEGVRVKKPVVLRVAVPGTIEELLVGKRFAPAGKGKAKGVGKGAGAAAGPVVRRAHFVGFSLVDGAGGVGGPADVALVVSPMLAGRFVLAAADEKSPADLAVAWALDDGRELRYRDDVQMGKVYVVPRGEEAAHVPGWARVGIDVLDRKLFTRDAFRALARTRRDQAKVFLMDKGALDAMGNAYADEVLWAARIHPKTMVRKLSDEDLDRLHDAIAEVLGAACAEIARRAPPLDEKVRDFLKVRNRHGSPCPRCGTKLRRAGVHGHDADFCPTCQPATRPSLVDWRKLGDGS